MHACKMRAHACMHACTCMQNACNVPKKSYSVTCMHELHACIDLACMWFTFVNACACMLYSMCTCEFYCMRHACRHACNNACHFRKGSLTESETSTFSFTVPCWRRLAVFFDASVHFQCRSGRRVRIYTYRSNLWFHLRLHQSKVWKAHVLNGSTSTPTATHTHIAKNIHVHHYKIQLCYRRIKLPTQKEVRQL